MPQRIGNRDPSAAPHGVYQCQGDDRWCAIAVQTEEQWSAFCQAIGNPGWCGDAGFASLESRLANQDRLDQLVGEWSASQTAEDAMSRLQEAGVPASIVSQGQDLYESEHLKARDFYRPTPFYLADRERPAYEWDGKEGISAANPPKLSESPMDYGSYSNIGEDNDYVFKEVLGMSQAEVDRLTENQSLY
jgi:crotonobetainyl-CoA:carnitine CoA-transferase CaiB-like acyl-CoA transferase